MRALALTWLLVAACGSQPLPSTSPTPVTTDPPTSSAPASVRYVALGDSYTIGTSVMESERFPNQLVERLRGVVELELVANLAVNGWTSGDLIDGQLPALADLRPDFVTLLIGVNDVVQGVPRDTYAANVDRILGVLLAVVPRERIVVVSTPDYTRTPRGADYGDRSMQRAGIAEVNRIMREACEQRGIAFVDIGPVADQADSDPTLVAGDLLHPSGIQYGRWVDLIAPVVERLLSSR